MSDAASILGAFRAYIVQVAAVTALMGTTYQTRIRPEVIPLGSDYGVGKPHVVYQQINTPDIRILSGAVKSLHATALQVDVYSKDPQERDNLSQEVRLAMRRWRGTWGGLEIRDVAKDYDGGSSANPGDGSEEMDWRQTFRFTVWHRNITEA